jgi:hypothetical protein
MTIARANGTNGRPSDPLRRNRARIAAAQALVHMSRYTGRRLSPAIVELANQPLPQRPS